MIHRSRFTLTALALIASAAMAPQAKASGFQLREQSPSNQGMSFAGVTAGGTDISSLYFNPAVMTQYQDTQFSFGATYIGLSAKIVDATASRTPALQALGFYTAPVSGASLSPISGSSSHPNAAVSATIPEFNIAYALTKDLRLGLSVNVPFGLATEYDANWIGRYHALKTDLKTIDIAPSLAYRLSPELSIGVAFIARKADAEISSAVDFGTALALKVGSGLAGAGLSPVPPAPGQNSPVANVAMGPANPVFGTPGNAIPGAWDGKAGMKGGCWGYGWKVGITFEPTQELRFGFAYNAAMTLKLSGDATFEYPAGLPASDAAALTAAGLTNTHGTADLDLPSTASLGFTWKVTPTFTLGGEAALTTWSRFSELRLKFDSGAPDNVTDESWRDTMALSIGGEWKLNGGWTLRTGATYDQGAVDETHRTPRIPDNDRKWVNLGVGYAISKKITVDVGYSRLFISDGKMKLSAGDATGTDPNTVRGNLSGTIQADINLFGASLRYNF